MALAGLLAWRVFSPAAGVATVALLALLPTLGEIASGVLADVMYAAVLLACVTAIGATLERGPLAWLGAGAMIGVAYLTKGNAHLAFLGLVTAGMAVRGSRLLFAPHIYAAAAGFVAVTWFLLWRNAVVFKNPFHNFNDQALWLDGWNDVWRLLRDPEWDRVGLRWYLQHHSLWALAWRVVKGAGQSIGVLLYTAGPGVTAGTPADLRPTIVAAILRVVGGVVVLALAARGLVDRYRTDIAPRCWPRPTSAAGCCWRSRSARRAWAASRRASCCRSPCSASPTRPMRWFRGASAGGRRPGSRARGRASRCWFPSRSSWPGSRRRSPRTRARRSRCRRGGPRRRRGSARTFKPRERLRRGTSSLYSTWDDPFPDPDARWLYLFDRPAAQMLADMARGTPASIEPLHDGPAPPVTKVLVDMATNDVDRYRDKMAGPADDHGPLAFLGWPRCFADGDRPSRFLIYCRP